MKTRKENGEGSCRKLAPNKWECVVQSKYINPKTMKEKRIKRIGKTEKEARENARMALDAWEREMINYQKDIKNIKSKTFGEYMDEYMLNEVQYRIQDGSFHTYYSSFQRYFMKYKIAKMQLSMLNVKVFEDYYNELSEKYSKKTVSTPVQWCRQMCSRLVDRKLLKENFALQAQPRKEIIDEYIEEQEERERTRKKIYTIEDIQKFYDAYKNGLGEIPLIVIFLLETGLRAQEFASIKVKNIDFDKRIIYIKTNRALRYKDNNDPSKGLEYYIKHPKNNKTREVYMSDLCLEVVNAMIVQTKMKCKKNVDGYLYPTFRTGQPRSNATLENTFKDLCNKIGVDRDVRLTKTGQKKGLCLHALRDTMSSLAKSQGTPTSSVALFLGHSERVNEEHYTFADIDVLKSVKTPSMILQEQQDDKQLWEEFLEFKKWKQSIGEQGN